MIFKFTHITGRRFVTFFLITSLASASFLPLLSRKAEAFGFGVVSVPILETIEGEETISKYVRLGLSIAAKALAQAAIERIVSSTVKWANTGFEGNPAYVTNPSQYFTDIADGVAGKFIQEDEQLGFLCSPFRATVRLSLAQQYYEPDKFQCTLSEVFDNIEDAAEFYEDFSKGGWDAWFAISQNPTNNPYGAYLEAKLELDSRVASAIGLKSQELSWNQGYLSWANCVKKQEGTRICLERGPVRTPGGHIKSQLDKILPSGLEKLIKVEHMEDLLEAFAIGLLQKYVFGSNGLFSNDGRNGVVPSGGRTVDIDGDSIIDGLDTNNDGQPDICYYGGVATASNPPCRGSKDRTEPPYIPSPGTGGGGGGGGSCTPPTRWDWSNRNGPAFESSKCPSINPQTYFEGLIAGKSINQWQQSLLDIEPQLFACGIGQQRDSSFTPRGRLFLPHAACPDASPRPGDEARLGVSQNPACWDSYVDVVGGMTCTPGGSGGGGGQCATSGNIYTGALRSAMDSVLSENQSLANSLNTTSNSRTFLNLVASKLQSQGYNATTDVLNGNNNPNTGDLIAVWGSSQTMMERYDAIISVGAGDRSITAAATTQFVGFVPLNCTTSGGGTQCGCSTGGPPPPPPTTPPQPGTATISSISPLIAQRGVTTITISGSNLTNQVSFYDQNGARNTVTGTVNSARTQTTVLVPSDQPTGSATVRIYQGNQVWSNGVSITINASGTSNIPTVTPTSSWSPPQSTNNWWPVISPDGRYVTYGNWGESWVTDLETKQTWDFRDPPGLTVPHRCIAGHWITNTTMTFVCEINTNANGDSDTKEFYRYEVKVGEWIPTKTSDDPKLVYSTTFVAEDGHWATYLAENTFRIAKDNAVLATGIGGALSISSNTLVHACTNDNVTICVREGSVLSRTYPVRTPMYQTDVKNGYIAYGGYGPIRGITPSGTDIDLTATGWRREGVPIFVMVNGQLWLATFAWDDPRNINVVVIRPWGVRNAIVVKAQAASLSVGFANNNFIVAASDDKGRMTVRTVPLNSTRVDLTTY